MLKITKKIKKFEKSFKTASYERWLNGVKLGEETAEGAVVSCMGSQSDDVWLLSVSPSLETCIPHELRLETPLSDRLSTPHWPLVNDWLTSLLTLHQYSLLNLTYTVIGIDHIP